MKKAIYDVLGVLVLVQSGINTVVFPLIMAVSFGRRWLWLYLFYVICFAVVCAVSVKAKNDTQQKGDQ